MEYKEVTYLDLIVVVYGDKDPTHKEWLDYLSFVESNGITIVDRAMLEDLADQS